ncbi:protein mono-ADP-ribosyltransferase PARP12-like isoform X2 [Engystomops pustulosus]|uniref:protein mono-ADP-ribosyltransferase PARP12-like isoform X2 n=1 Tax=Engystomops pustulosus TaxID=76066 RepID=UPI003AFB601B
MSDPTVTAFLTKILCSHGGRLSKDLLSGYLDLSREQIEQILEDEPQKFPVVGDLVLVRSPVRICPKYLKNEPEEECDKLHLCRDYLQSKCWSGKRPECKISHNVLSDHNQKVLKANEISGLSEEEVKILLLQNDHQLLPEVCVMYLHATCDVGGACIRLHACGFFTRGECNHRPCKYSHNLLDSASGLLIGRCRIPEISLQNLQMICTIKHNERLETSEEKRKKENKKSNSAAEGGRRAEHRNRTRGDSKNVIKNIGHWSPHSNTVEADKVPEICLHNVWKYCRLGTDRCPDMHYYLPYRWQIYKGTDWEDVSNMEDIERQYCDPKVDRIPLIDFLTMRSGEHRVRRLATVSSVKMPSEYVLTTEWLWYWQDEYGTWTQYGHSNLKTVSSNISSSDLENIYLSDPTAVVDFSAGNQSYEVNFREMKQKNIKYQTEKAVHRRPKFLSFEDVKSLRGSTKSDAAPSPLKSGLQKRDLYPSAWCSKAMLEVGCQKVLVLETSSEFLEIVSIFTKTVTGHVVKKMWRLQNPSLWQVFQWQKAQMKKLSPGRDVKEVQLFHGTEESNVDPICNHNFDWRICGTHGTMYGQGSYFARDASYSYNYSKPTSGGSRMMFVARVLVGDYVVGDPSMKRPPPRPGSSSRYYDSCVDDATDPSIYVVFEKHQIYPEYLLEYEEQKQKSCVIS